MKKWQEECYLGKHVGFVPAENAHGYTYRGPRESAPAGPAYTPQGYARYPTGTAYAYPEGVQRAIPAEGRVQNSSPFDKPAPQLWMWFETAGKKKVRFKRIRRREEEEW